MKRDQLTEQQKDYSLWPTVDAGLLEEEDKEQYQQKKTLVIAYLNGTQVNRLSEQYQITPNTIRRYVFRCYAQHEDGRIWGFRALIPYKRIKEYQRSISTVDHQKSNRGNAGLLMQLFFKYPHIQESVDAFFLKKVNSDSIVHESRIPVQSIHAHFVTLCRDAGIKGSEYPFNVLHLGHRSIANYLTKLKHREIMKAAKARYGKEATRLLGFTTQQSRPIIIEPYRRVQFDGHRIDAIFTITLPSPYGIPTEVTVTRPWLLLIQEIVSRAVLGYYICLKKEFSSEDVLECVKKAIIPWQPKELSIPTLKYTPNSGFPPGVIDELAWAVWDELAYDNAKANLSDLVTGKLIQMIGCSINAGPAKMPEKRGFIERLFGILEESGYHRLPSTTGSNPTDTRRNAPEAAALKYKISLDALEDITDILIANYNSTPHSGIGHRSPLEYLTYYLDYHKPIIRKVPEMERDAFNIHSLTVQRVVRGNIAHGRRPFIYFEGVRYSNEVLSRSPDLIGKTLNITVNTDEIRSVKAFFMDGSELGILTALGLWGRTPHDLTTRRAINSLRYRRILHITQMEDPIIAYVNWLNEQARHNKGARSEHVRVQKHLPPETKTNSPENVESRAQQENALKESTKSDIDPIKKRFLKISKTMTY